MGYTPGNLTTQMATNRRNRKRKQSRKHSIIFSQEFEQNEEFESLVILMLVFLEDLCFAQNSLAKFDQFEVYWNTGDIKSMSETSFIAKNYYEKIFLDAKNLYTDSL